MRQKDLTIPLGIPDVQVLETSTNERGAIIITLESAKPGTRCRKCGQWITKSHGVDEWITIRHLPAFERPLSKLPCHPRRPCTNLQWR